MTRALWPFLLSAPAVCLVVGLLACPLVLVARVGLYEPPTGQGFFVPGTWTAANYAEATDAYGLRLLGYTVGFGAVVALVVVLAAYPLALYSRSLAPPWRGLGLAGVMLPKLASVLVVLFGLRQLFVLAGLSRGPVAAVLGEAFLILPYAVLVLFAQAQGISPDLEAAARGLGASRWQAFWRVTLPLSVPGLVLAGQLSFMWGMGAFLGPMLLGGPEEMTISVEVHRQAFEYGRWPRAAAEATLLMVTMAVAVLAYSLTTRRGAAHAPSHSETAPEATSWPGHVLGWAAIALLLAPLLFAVLVSFSPGSFLAPPDGRLSLRWYGAFASDRRWLMALARSLVVAVASAAVAVGAGAALAYAVARYEFRGRVVLGGMALLPAFVPPAALGMGLLPLLYAAGLWGNLLGLVLVHGLVGLPVTYLVARGHLDQAGPDLEAAARGLGASGAQVLWRVALPLLRPALLAGAVAAFAVSLNESMLTLFLSTPSTETLPAVVWPELRYAPSPLVAVASCVSVAVALVAAGVVGWVVGPKRAE